MRTLAGAAGILALAIVLWEAFETVILPRRVTRRFRLTRFFYDFTWLAFAAAARLIRRKRPREAFVSAYGPMSLLLLLGVWALGLIAGFALIDWAMGDESFASRLYLSGTSFFTLGLGDVVPKTSWARVLTVVEAGTGFAFLAIVIGYLPVIFSAFSRREVNISLLDARAGSPPTAAELLRRGGSDGAREALGRFLTDWETWSAELMESHLSYPVLCYFRSQHDNQSWLAALTTVLDACAFVESHVEGVPSGQARLTFAIARHAVVDLAQVLNIPPRDPPVDRLPAGGLDVMRRELGGGGMRLCESSAARFELARLRRLYEPYVHALAEHLLLELPPWMAENARIDNWQASAFAATPEGQEPGGPEK
jgi:Ion channel